MFEMNYVGERPWCPIQSQPKQWKKEDSERLRRKGDKIKYIDLRFKRGQSKRTYKPILFQSLGSFWKK